MRIARILLVVRCARFVTVRDYAGHLLLYRNHPQKMQRGCAANRKLARDRPALFLRHPR